MQLIRKLRKKIKETLPFTIATNNIKYPGVILTEEVKDLLSKNFKKVQKEFKEDTRKWEDLPCSWISRTTIIKMAVAKTILYL